MNNLRSRLATVAVLGVALVLAPGACDDVRSNESKQMPQLPPPPQTTLQPLRIAIEIGGVAAPPITEATLAKIPPDFVEGEHRAWRISTLLGDALGEPMTRAELAVTVTGAHGVTIHMAASPALDRPAPTLFVTRRGDVIAALVNPRDPFPDFHGKGRRLGRPGDPMPRVAEVSKIQISKPTP